MNTNKENYTTGYVDIPNLPQLIKQDLITHILKQNNSIGIVSGDFNIDWDCGGIAENSLWFKFSCTINKLSIDYISIGEAKYKGEFNVNIFTKKTDLDIYT